MGHLHKTAVEAGLLSLVLVIVGAGDAGAQGVNVGAPATPEFICVNAAGDLTMSNAPCTDDSGHINVHSMTFNVPATFNGTTTIGGTTTFTTTPTFNAGLTTNGAATFNDGLTTDGATVNGASTFNGSVTVQAGQTVNFNGNRLQGVGTPTAATDAANKQYVDSANSAQDAAVAAQFNVQQTQINTIEATNITQQMQIDGLAVASNHLQNQINGLQSDVRGLRERDEELAEGIAIALALDAPVLRSGQTFAMRGGWGNFDGFNAAGVTAAGALSSNVVVDAGVGWGTAQGTVAGKAGVTLGW